MELRDDFQPLACDELLLAHTPEYVDAFMAGTQPLCEGNGLHQSSQFRDSVLVTNACLLAAIRAANQSPAQATMAPVSGFHHARPTGGAGYCTFSGQVIAVLQLQRHPRPRRRVA